MKFALALFAGLLLPAAASAFPLFGKSDAPHKALKQLFTDEQSFTWKEDPLQASGDGIRLYDDRLPSALPADFDRRLKTNEGFLDRLHAIKHDKLSTQDQINYDLFDFMVDARVRLAKFREWRTPLNSDSGFHVDVLLMHELADTQSVAGYEHYIARLRDAPRYFRENIANMRAGAAEGWTLPAAILEGVSSIIAGEQVHKPEDSPLYLPFKNFPDRVPEAERTRLAAAGSAAIADAVMPAYAEFQRFFNEEYRVKARASIGAADLPDGKAYYPALVRYFTTLDLAPDAVHEIGLKEVARIHADMDKTMREAGFKGNFANFLKFLRTDKRFYAKSPDELLKDAAFLSKEIDGKLPQFFGKLPRMTYRVEPVPAAIAPNYTVGRYNPGPNDGRAPGTYWVNTYALDRRPLYALPALTLHEAVPGHHLQGALAREVSDVPAFRNNLYLSAYGEGWGLYCEKLGREMGIYKTPYEEFGRESYEMWRAVRLVVDTGMHWKGWTRQQAIDYLSQNTALSDHEIRTEIDRYIAWPGQALSYKIGELKLLELRARAEKELGPKFDVRTFHDAVLDSGTMTLPMLERQISAYITAAKAAAP